MCKITNLPATMSSDDRAFLELSGVRLGPPLPDDPLFCKAVLPKGWRKEETDHPLWSNLVDDKGEVRAKIFYKAAFHDRDAFLRVTDS